MLGVVLKQSSSGILSYGGLELVTECGPGVVRLWSTESTSEAVWYRLFADIANSVFELVVIVSCAFLPGYCFCFCWNCQQRPRLASVLRCSAASGCCLRSLGCCTAPGTDDFSNDLSDRKKERAFSTHEAVPSPACCINPIRFCHLTDLQVTNKAKIGPAGGLSLSVNIWTFLENDGAITAMKASELRGICSRPNKFCRIGDCESLPA